MLKHNQYVYLCINTVLLFLCICIIFVLRPLLFSILEIILKIISPFILGFTIFALVYPLVKNIKNIILKMMMALFVYFILIVSLVIIIGLSIPQLLEDYQLFCNYFKIQPFLINENILNELHTPIHIIELFVNGVVISFFYLFNQRLVSYTTSFFPKGSHLIVRYYLFIHYFYQLLKHLLIRALMVLVILLSCLHPYAFLIAGLSFIGVIPIIGNMILYLVLLLCSWYYPIILLPLFIILIYDGLFYRKFKLNIVYLVLSLVLTHLLHPFFIIFSLPVYFLMIEIKSMSYSTIRRLENE